MSENNKMFDEEWQKLREEYKELIGNKDVNLTEEKPVEISISDIEEISLSIPDLEITDKKKENSSTNNEQNTELESLKMEKDRYLQNEDDIEEVYKETTKQDGLFNKSVNHLKQKIVFVLEDFDKRKVKTKQPYWTEENKQDIANVIVVMIFICCFLVFCFSITKISVGIFNILEKTREHDIIMEEELVSVDETERIYHFDNCPHIKDDMRYLKLEEPYAIQLGYERCNLYKKFGK